MIILRLFLYTILPSRFLSQLLRAMSMQSYVRTEPMTSKEVFYWGKLC